MDSMQQRYQIGDQPKQSMTVIDVLYGGMGIIYVLEPAYGSYKAKFKYAIKSCDVNMIMGDEGLEKIYEESLIWISLLPHPNIVKALSFELDGGLPNLLMEYQEGGNLRDKLKKDIPTMAEFLRIANEFCEGMSFLNDSYKIVHRDIKPENILFSADGQLKITDFGIAGGFDISNETLIGRHRQHQGGEQNDFERQGFFAGTIPYMSPEQFVSFQTVDTRSDIYSFGVVMYEMLSGRLPFNESSAERMMHAHQSISPPALSQNTPPELHTIVLKCLAKNPLERFESFKELSNKLEEFCRRNEFESSIPEHYPIDNLEELLSSADWNNRGYSFSQLEYLPEALRCYHKAIEKEKNSDTSENFLMTPGVDKKIPSSKGQLAVTYCNIGTTLMRMNRLDEAREAFNNALEAVPDDGVTYFRLGELEFAEGNVQKGLSYFKKSTECEPGNIDLLMKYMRVCYQLGEHEAFEAGFSEFIEAKKNDIPFLIVAGCNLDDLLGPEIALRCFDTALQHDPDNASAWYNKGVTLQRMGQDNAALKAYEEVIRLDRTHSFARCYISIILLKLGRKKEAQWQLEKFLENSDDNILREFVVLAVQGSHMGLPLEQLLLPLGMPQALKHIA